MDRPRFSPLAGKKRDRRDYCFTTAAGFFLTSRRAAFVGETREEEVGRGRGAGKRRRGLRVRRREIGR